MGVDTHLIIFSLSLPLNQIKINVFHPWQLHKNFKSKLVSSRNAWRTFHRNKVVDAHFSDFIELHLTVLKLIVFWNIESNFVAYKLWIFHVNSFNDSYGINGTIAKTQIRNNTKHKLKHAHRFFVDVHKLAILGLWCKRMLHHPCPWNFQFILVYQKVLSVVYFDDLMFLICYNIYSIEPELLLMYR